MKQDEDKNIKNAFRQMGDQAKQEAPPYDLVWIAAEKKMVRRKQRRLYARISVAASIGILVFSLFIIGSPNEKRQQVHEVGQLSTWESPTDMLLQNVVSVRYQGSLFLPTDALLLPLQEQIPNEADEIPH